MESSEDVVVVAASQNSQQLLQLQQQSERRRSDAHQQVAEKWANRRRSSVTLHHHQQQQQQQQPLQPQTSATGAAVSTEWLAETREKQQQNVAAPSSATTAATASSNPSVCFLLGQLWKEALKLNQPQPLPKSRPPQAPPPQQLRTKRAAFPSVLNILHERALKHQIELFDTTAAYSSSSPAADTDTGNKDQSTIQKQQQQQPKDENITTSLSSSSSTPSSILNVLPAHYDFSQAIFNMACERSRAFLLLDLAAIVKSHVYWRKQLPLGTAVLTSSSSSNNNNNNNTKKKKESFVRMAYSIGHNANPQLLQVLQRLNVACKVSTKYDLEPLLDKGGGSSSSSSSSSSGASSPTNCVILDDASCSAKPNSFYRKLVLDQHVTTLAVNGPEEVLRLYHTLKAIARRRKQPEQEFPTLSFVVRLGGGGGGTTTTTTAMNMLDVELYKQKLQQTMGAIQTLLPPHKHELVGISLELPCCYDHVYEKRDDTQPNATDPLSPGFNSVDDENDIMMQNFCNSVKDLLIFMRDELHCPCQELDFTTTTALTMSSTSLSPIFLDWLSQMQPKKSSSSSSALPSTHSVPSSTSSLVQRVTLDVSYLLVARAGALCTRIIGVKEQQQPPPNNDNDEGATAQTNDKVTMTHYYIDDGCYGSLYSATKDVVHIPLPLKKRQEGNPAETIQNVAATTTMAASASDVSIKDDKCNEKSDEGLSGMTRATVWGPTCDGLDKVCQDIILPKLERDDWLVFPNLGFCNVGTAFNGFPPPDLAYCVLGYLHQQEKR